MREIFASQPMLQIAIYFTVISLSSALVEKQSEFPLQTISLFFFFGGCSNVHLLLLKRCSIYAGGSSKTLMIVHLCPNASNLSETLSTLNFSARARNAVLSLGNRDTIKKWRDIVSSNILC